MERSFYNRVSELGYSDILIEIPKGRTGVVVGIGYSDILIETRRNRIGIVVEMKYAEDGNLEAACQKALQQIEDKKYESKLKEDGMRRIIKYGIACYKKDCKVMIGDDSDNT